MFRFWAALSIVALTGAFGSLVFPPRAAFDTQPAKFTAYELAMAERWVKGAAPVLAGNFDQVVISNIGEQVDESLDFDKTLVRMYEIDADYKNPPIDARAFDLEDEIEPYVQFYTDTFCNVPGDKYCLMSLAWDENSTGEFTTIMYGERSFSIVANNLLRQWGVIE